MTDKKEQLTSSCPRKALRFFSRRLLLWLVCGIVVLMVVCFWLITRKPEDFGSAKKIVEGNQISPYFTNYIAQTIYNNSQFDDPFELVITQDGANEMIADEDLMGFPWPVKMAGVEIALPEIFFNNNLILLVGNIKIGSVDIVVSVEIAPRIVEDNMMVLDIGSIKAGDLNITFLAKKITAMILADELKKDVTSDNAAFLGDLKGVLMENKPFDPVIMGFKRELRISVLQIHTSAVKLVLQPL